MSILDDNLQNQFDIKCYEHMRDRIEEFIYKYMNGLWVDQYMGARNDGISFDATSFLYGYNDSNETFSQKSYVRCNSPILCEHSLALYYCQDIHSYPFIIHDYPAEELPGYIQFINQFTDIDIPIFDMDENINIYYSHQEMLDSTIPIYIHNCPNLKKRDIDKFINFIEL